MARIDERTEQMLQALTEGLSERHGENLLSVILYGSAAGLHYLPGISDLNLLVVLKAAAPDQLGQAAEQLKQFRKEPIDPLFLTETQIASLGEAFPIEACELIDQRQVLHGEDVIAEVIVSLEALRHQLLREIHGTAIRLREIYVDCGGKPARLEQALKELVSPMGTLLRSLLRVSDAYSSGAAESELPPPHEYLETLTQLEPHLERELHGLRYAHHVRTGMERPPAAEIQALYGHVIQDVEDLMAQAPRLISQAGG